MSDTTSTHDDLWAGVHLKLSFASIHFTRMSDVLQPPKLDGHMVAIQSSGALIGGNWHEALRTFRRLPVNDAEYARTYSMLLWCGLWVKHDQGLV